LDDIKPNEKKKIIQKIKKGIIGKFTKKLYLCMVIASKCPKVFHEVIL
jgi:hypothetical protein